MQKYSIHCSRITHDMLQSTTLRYVYAYSYIQLIANEHVTTQLILFAFYFVQKITRRK